mmetsp:Transcript_7728/g.14019  ORF Transcript_7728/g.14019 Transcript_7728/m.14019 type:complete len:240 (+) Transcript_7728:323-1042(+)
MFGTSLALCLARLRLRGWRGRRWGRRPLVDGRLCSGEGRHFSASALVLRRDGGRRAGPGARHRRYAHHPGQNRPQWAQRGSGQRWGCLAHCRRRLRDLCGRRRNRRRRSRLLCQSGAGSSSAGDLRLKLALALLLGLQGQGQSALQLFLFLLALARQLIICFLRLIKSLEELVLVELPLVRDQGCLNRHVPDSSDDVLLVVRNGCGLELIILLELASINASLGLSVQVGIPLRHHRLED